MKKLIFLLILTIIIGLFPMDIYAISARSAVVMDAASGRILYKHNASERRGMASTTKIMTAICALEHSEMNKIVTVSPTASGVEGSSMYLAKGEKIKMDDLVYGLMLVSGNDAATAIAEAVSGSVEEFAKLMNKKAVEIGVVNTNFTNPHGLSDENHYTTAQDLAKITVYAMQNPLFCEIVATKRKSLPSTEGGYARTLVNHNKFLSMYDNSIGVKTGFTKATGRCLVTAAEKNGMRLVCVTLNDPDDWSDHKTLFDDSFSTFLPFKLKSANETVATAKVKDGTDTTLELVTASDLYLPIRQGEEDGISIETELFEELTAPIKKGDTLGKIIVKVDNEICGEFPAVAACDLQVKKAIFKKSISFAASVKRVFYSWLTCFQ